ncbi:MAG: acetyl-CoA carboxylase biotin carboxylase subunit [Betaproteobacteria bacterium]
MFGALLIANRGEIACRVMRTARRMDLRTIAVYSDADRDALHVRLADAAFRIGPPAPRESYLDIDALLDAARRSGAQAIHPGYGFLSENEDFAAACAKAGIAFVGPGAAAIAAMGDKAAAKRKMAEAGVPLVPGYHGEDQDAARLENEAAAIGFPVLIKPSAGGGGKGMRVVRSRNDFRAALAGARREAAASFGDDRVLIERYLERPRHIEVQVFGDTHGNVVHLFERDCSVQRRHQKVLEEAPAPGMTEARRREMGEAALAAARAIGYVSAGTVEFIAEQDGRFYFMEMNTRLQVEHPVTEMVTGLDLVEWQLRVAAGERLPKLQNELALSGHAIEARIYAEDPQRDFLPQMGRIAHLAFPADARIDSGVETGAEITPWYDPMLAKLIVHGASRAEALARLRQALAQTEIAGVQSNLRFLQRVAASRAFDDADLDTGLIERNAAELHRPEGAPSVRVLAALAFAELADEERAAREHAAASTDPHSPWHRVDGWRLNQASHHEVTFVGGEARHVARIDFRGSERTLTVDGRDYALYGESLGDGRVQVRLDGEAFKARAVRTGNDWHVFCDGEHRVFALEDPFAGLEADTRAGSLAAPMPGKVIQVLVKTGAKVSKGDALLVLEAMKMEHTITAPADGVVQEIHYGAGEQVLEGAELITLG